MSEEFFTNNGSDFAPRGMLKELVNGIHHVKLMKSRKEVIKHGAETLKGNEQVVWEFMVLGGPSSGANMWYSTPMSGYIVKDGQRFDMSNYTRKVVAALDPTWTTYDRMDRELLVAKEAEINIEIKKNADGTTSLFPRKVLWIRPWFNNAGDSILKEKIEKRKEEVVDHDSVHF